jgi:hypothetical protein
VRIGALRAEAVHARRRLSVDELPGLRVRAARHVCSEDVRERRGLSRALLREPNLLPQGRHLHPAGGVIVAPVSSSGPRSTAPQAPRSIALALDATTESRFTLRPREENRMAVDIKKLFNDDLPGALSRNADDAKTIGAKYQMNITGEGEWNIDVSSSGPSCKPGSAPADCTITIAADDFQKLVENPQANGMQLFFAGKLKVAGNQMLAMKLQKLFSYK